MVGVVEVPAAVADHHLAEFLIPAEMNPQGSAFRIFGTDLEVLPHLHAPAVITERALPSGLGVAFDRLGFPGGIVATPEDLTGETIRSA